MPKGGGSDARSLNKVFVRRVKAGGLTRNGYS